MVKVLMSSALNSAWYLFRGSFEVFFSQGFSEPQSLAIFGIALYGVAYLARREWSPAVARCRTIWRSRIRRQLEPVV
jgi:hypothetical protein